MKTRSYYLLMTLATLFLFALSSCAPKSSYDEAQSRLAQVQKEKSGLEEKVLSLSADLTRERNNVATAVSELDSVKTGVSALKTSLSGEQANVRTLSSEADAMKTRFSEQDARFSKLDGQIFSLESSLSREKDITGSLRTQLARTEAARVSLEKEVASLLVTYRDDKNGFSIDYPKNWTRRIEADGSPSFADNVKFVTANIGVALLQTDMSTSQYWDKAKAVLSTRPTYMPVDTSGVSVSGMPAIGHVYTIDLPASQTRSTIMLTQIFLVKEKHAWTLTFATSPDNFERYSTIFERMVQSFKLF